VEGLITAIRVFSPTLAQLVRSVDDHRFYVLFATEPVGGYDNKDLADAICRDKETLLHACMEGTSKEFIFDPPLPLNECTKEILKRRGISE